MRMMTSVNSQARQRKYWKDKLKTASPYAIQRSNPTVAVNTVTQTSLLEITTPTSHTEYRPKEGKQDSLSLLCRSPSR